MLDWVYRYCASLTLCNRFCLGQYKFTDFKTGTVTRLLSTDFSLRPPQLSVLFKSCGLWTLFIEDFASAINYTWKWLTVLSMLMQNCFNISLDENHDFFLFSFYILQLYCPFGFLQWKTQVAFPWESQLQQSHTIQPMVHAGCFSVSIIHRTMTWTTRSLTCTRILMHEIAHRGCAGTTRESALKVDSGRKIPCLTGESNLFNFGVNSVPRKKQTYFLPHPPPTPTTP